MQIVDAVDRSSRKKNVVKYLKIYKELVVQCLFDISSIYFIRHFYVHPVPPSMFFKILFLHKKYLKNRYIKKASALM